MQINRFNHALARTCYSNIFVLPLHTSRKFLEPESVVSPQLSGASCQLSLRFGVRLKNSAIYSELYETDRFAGISCQSALSNYTVMAPKTVFDSADAQACVKDLRTVFRTGRTRSLQWREAQLQALEDMTVQHADAILQALVEDLGKPKLEAYGAEIEVIRAAAREARQNLKRWAKPTKVSTNLVNFPAACYTVPEPYGVVLIFGAWNYPFLLAMEPVIGAIAAGNTVVLKPSEMAPATSALLSKLYSQHLDQSAIVVIEGGIPESTALLEQKWDKIFFTGNGTVGKIVAIAAAKNLTPVTLELGGKCPVIVDSTVDMKRAARRIAFGRFFNGGQTCMACDYVLVEESVADKLTETLKEVLKEFYGEEGTKTAEMARVVNAKQFKRLQGYLAHPETAERIVYGGKAFEDDLFISPTLVRDAPWDSPLLTEEIFGPILPIQTVKNIDEAIEIVKERPKPLAVYPFSTNKNVVEHIISETSSGAVCVNDAILQASNPQLPFGGVGESGHGAYHGKFSFDCFSHQKAVMHKALGIDHEARWPPATRAKEIFLRAVMDGDLLGVILILLGLRK